MDEITEDTNTETTASAPETTPQAGPTIVGLNPEFADNPSIKKFAGDVNKLASSYIEAQHFIGRNKIAVPSGDDDAQAWEVFDNAFSVPKTAEEYALENVPEGADLSTFKKLMKENHVPAKTAQKLCDAYIADITAKQNAEWEKGEREYQNALATLKKEWGMKFNANVQKATDFFKKNYGESEEDRREALDRYGNDPKFIKMLVNLAGRVSEGELGGMTGQETSFVKTPAEAQRELNAILSDTTHPYWTGARNHRDNAKWASDRNMTVVSPAEHRAAIERVEALKKMIGG